MVATRAIVTDGLPRAAIRGHYGRLEVTRVNVTTWEAFFRARTPDGHFGPEFSTRLSLVEPLSDEDTLAFWKMLVDDLFRVLGEKGEIPGFVQGKEVQIGEDSTGSPSLFLTILVPPAAKYSFDAVSEWVQFSNLLQSHLLNLQLKRYPYIRVKARRKAR
jgi:hypothetical protein